MNLASSTTTATNPPSTLQKVKFVADIQDDGQDEETRDKIDNMMQYATQEVKMANKASQQQDLDTSVLILKF